MFAESRSVTSSPGRYRTADSSARQPDDARSRFSEISRRVISRLTHSFAMPRSTHVFPVRGASLGKYRISLDVKQYEKCLFFRKISMKCTLALSKSQQFDGGELSHFNNMRKIRTFSFSVLHNLNLPNMCLTAAQRQSKL